MYLEFEYKYAANGTALLGAARVRGVCQALFSVTSDPSTTAGPQVVRRQSIRASALVNYEAEHEPSKRGVNAQRAHEKKLLAELINRKWIHACKDQLEMKFNGQVSDWFESSAYALKI